MTAGTESAARRVRGLFLLVVRGLPANTSAALSFGGSDVFTAKTNRRGLWRIMKSPPAPNGNAAAKSAASRLLDSVNIFADALQTRCYTSGVCLSQLWANKSFAQMLNAD